MADFTIAVKYKDGAIYSGSGYLEIESWTSADSIMTCKLIPRSGDGFALVAMGSGDQSGTPQAVRIAGVTYNVAGDADFSHTPSRYKNEPVPHTGGNMRKMTLQAQEIGAVKLIVNAREYAAIQALAQT